MSKNMNILFKFDYKAYLGRIAKAAQRFPIALFWCVLLLAMICFGKYIPLDGRTRADLSFFPVAFFFISVALRLLSERVENVVLSWTIRIVPLLLCCGVPFLLYEHMMEYRRLTLYLCISLPVAVLVFFFTCLFLKRENDLQFCKFAGNVFKALGIGLVSTAVLFGLYFLVRVIIALVSGFHIEGRDLEWVMCVLLLTILPLVMLSHINSRTEIDSPLETGLPKWWGRFVRFVLLGILLLIISKIYFDGFKALFLQELPRCSVFKMVSAGMFLMMLVLFCLYPNWKLKCSKFDEAVFKYLPIAMMPPLLFLSVAVFIRFADYGITINRLWLLVLIIWCWVVCIYLAVSARKRMVWIPVSFAVLFLVLSLRPWGVPYVTTSMLEDQVRAWAEDRGYSVPVDCEYVPDSDTLMIAKLEYLAYHDCFNVANRDCFLYSVRVRHRQEQSDHEEYEKYYDDKDIDIKIDHHVENFLYVDCRDIRLYHTENPDSLYHISLKLEDRVLVYDVPKTTFASYPGKVVLKNENSNFVIKYYSLEVNSPSISDYDKIEINGFLFEW